MTGTYNPEFIAVDFPLFKAMQCNGNIIPIFHGKLTILKYYFVVQVSYLIFCYNLDFCRYPIISEDEGLPPPSAFQSLIPTMSSFYFPECFEIFARILRVHKDIEEAAFEVE